ncbi:MAG: gamma-glutamyltransferase [Thalassobaculum sp.]|uniref:gamma-glutamyltransferase family protein n=1 Tax=Thalassobaculum sp. TaxID=2022740 RepID=UPI0032EE4DA7
MPEGGDAYGGWVGWERAAMTRGAVACGNADASQAGVEILEAGGNAIDAAIACAFAMGVVEPLDSGLGAGGFMTLHHAASGTTTCLDFMGTAPAAARYELYQAVEPAGDYAIKVKGRYNEHGHRSVAVPGAAAGLCEAMERFGTLPRRIVLAPSIRLASEGFTVAAKAALRMARTADLLDLTDECRRVLKKPDGSLFQAGDRMAMPDYGRSLAAIAEHGPAAFYSGALAAGILADMAAHDGFLAAADLAGYRVVERAPATGAYNGRRIASMSPPSSGGLVAAGLAALERQGVADTAEGRAEALARAMLAMFESRRTGLGDPAFVKPAPIPTRGESTETTSLCAMDAAGNAACITYSNNNHSGVVVPGTGILLNNQMRLFHAWEGSPNSVAPGKRPASSMMPTLLFDGDRPAMAIGASGSTRIVTALMQIVFHHLGRGVPLEQAVREPRLHAEEDTLMADADYRGIAEPLAARLGLNFVVSPGRDPMMASCQTIAVEADGTATAVGDPRARAQGRVV